MVKNSEFFKQPTYDFVSYQPENLPEAINLSIMSIIAKNAI